MDKALITVAAAVTTVISVILVTLWAPIFGSLVGVIVGFFFDDTSRAFLDALGMKALDMWQFGAMTAFVATFFKK